MGNLKIAVLGAGAIGCYYGGVLAKEHADVTFIARRRTYDRLKHHELVVKSIHGDFSLPVNVIDSEHLEGHAAFDYILLAIKSTGLEAAIEELKVLMEDRTKIICLLNGIGNEERLAEVFGAQRVIGGSAFISIIREAPGVVHHVGDGKLVIGEWQSHTHQDAGLIELEKLLLQAGAAVRITSDIKRIKWEKLLWNITYNPLTALTQTRVGTALKDPDLKLLLERVSAEFLNLADKRGIIIREDYKTGLLTPDEEIQNHKTSMLQDFENGQAMELDAILGFVIQTAKQCAVSVPTIETLYHLLRFLERSH
ncbi:ketopantoate reductase family protein [Sporolactobacillus terrae]|uniref:ketopantoate reductase family protein n=1 Tax=Sporolactobacillus terrae TaxID=269673 RepID=UPI001F1E72BF|nr:ketopantoate reductase family protein [Sporolactobacillus terrae]